MKSAAAVPSGETSGYKQFCTNYVNISDSPLLSHDTLTEQHPFIEVILMPQA